MIAELVTFTHAEGSTREEILAGALSVAPHWQANPDLIRKHFLVSDDNRQGAGFLYLANTRSRAKGAFGRMDRAQGSRDRLQGDHHVLRPVPGGRQSSESRRPDVTQSDHLSLVAFDPDGAIIALTSLLLACGHPPLVSLVGFTPLIQVVDVLDRLFAMFLVDGDQDCIDLRLQPVVSFLGLR